MLSIRRRASSRLLLTGATAVGLALAGCGGDDGGGGGGGGESEQAQQPTETVAIEITGSGQNVEVTAPETVPAGLAEIELTNSADRPQDAQFIRVEGERSQEEVAEALGTVMEGGAFPEWFFAAGGPGETDPDATSTVVQPLEPGQYWVQAADSPQALRQGNGMVAMEVTGEPADAELPEADSEIIADEYSFEAQTLSADSPEIAFRNVGEQPHHVVAAPIVEGATFEEVEEFAQQQGPPQGPPPVDIENSAATTVVEGGDEQLANLELQPGRYALVCFITDRQGGPPHVAQGMIAEVEVE